MPGASITQSSVVIAAQVTLSRRSAPCAYSSAVRRNAASSSSRINCRSLIGAPLPAGRRQRQMTPCPLGTLASAPDRRPPAASGHRVREGIECARVSPHKRADCSSLQACARRRVHRPLPRWSRGSATKSLRRARRCSWPARNCATRCAAPRNGCPCAGSTIVSAGSAASRSSETEKVGRGIAGTCARVQADVARDARQQLIAADEQTSLAPVQTHMSFGVPEVQGRLPGIAQLPDAFSLANRRRILRHAAHEPLEHAGGPRTRQQGREVHAPGLAVLAPGAPPAARPRCSVARCAAARAGSLMRTATPKRRARYPAMPK